MEMTLLKKRRTLLLFSILTLLVFAVILLIPSSISRYKNSDFGDAQVETALWSVSAISSNSTINLVAGSTTTYTFTVNNDSDVAVIYSIEISNLPPGIQAKLDSGNYQSASNNKIVISPAGELGYSGTTQRTHTITFNTPLSASEISSRQININVTFSQKIN